MLAITAKVRLLKQEVFSAISICKDIIGSLSVLKPTDDYRQKIGIFAVQMPDWKILTDEKHGMIDTIRRVCTGEMTPTEASEKFTIALHELETISTWLQVPQK